MNYLIDPLLELREYSEVLEHINKNIMPVTITGPSDSQKAHICYGLCNHSGQKAIYVSHNEMQARRMYEDFSFFYGDDVLFFPSKEIMLYDVDAKSYDAIFQRIKTLDRIVQGDYKLVVTSAEALMHKLIPLKMFEESVLTIKMRDILEVEQLYVSLMTMGYERVTTVEGKGQYSVRGGIIDVFSINMENAVRVELFGDEVDSIRSFDVISQRSVDHLEEVHIIPAREVIYEVNKRQLIVENIRGDLNKLTMASDAATGKKNQDKEYLSDLKSNIYNDIERLRSDHYFAGIDRYIGYIIDKPAYITDYFKEKHLIFMDEASRIESRMDNVNLEMEESCKMMLQKGLILSKCFEICFTYSDFQKNADFDSVIYLNSMSVGSNFKAKGNYSIASKSLTSYQGKIDLLIEDLQHFKEKKYRTIVLSGLKARGERLSQEISNKGLSTIYVDDLSSELIKGLPVITRGSLHRGFEYPSIGFAILGDRELYGQIHKAPKKNKKSSGERIKAFTDVRQGDYVVHTSHGIGQYVGISQLEVEGVKRDYLKIRYLDNGYIYIPTNQMDLIHKYIGSEGEAPKLSKLGGADWQKAKTKVKESLRELAVELVKLYAKRKMEKGYAFGKDTTWQKEFEDAFPYKETDDQLRCIEEVKSDMESTLPMDRLLCGDVGYGKTEVAIRAIFKAIMDGKQVAYLCPTTILAQQHYANFKERMAEYPANVEVLSRFRSAADSKRVISELRVGNVDVLVGTHRLIQKDIKFKDLGLLIVDEEQRFGVGHKEKLKELKASIDCLTLSATPIPRTLHMSLVGIRDISVLDDPPEERYPVQTYVMEYNEDVIKDAITREIARNGQVFYLYNRVRTIDLKASEIQALIPEARVEIAHGQMSEKELEKSMERFLNKEYDVMICTTIIESGLDLPNANTIIVEDADRMGLSQLYQIRGRVGRSNRLAYAYITHKKDKMLSEVAEKRLQAIREFTEFGSGFKIAMRDLEIRGAGNILGPQQHGHMESVGYDMYCKLLDEAVKELSGEPISRKQLDVTIEISLSAFIDNGYITSETNKIEMYKRIASIETQEDVSDVQDELNDRYGDIPLETSNLINIAFIKAMAAECGFVNVSQKAINIVLQYYAGKKVDLQLLGTLMDKYKRRLLFTASSSPYLTLKVGDSSKGEILQNIKSLLQDIINLQKDMQ